MVIQAIWLKYFLLASLYFEAKLSSIEAKLNVTGIVFSVFCSFEVFRVSSIHLIKMTPYNEICVFIHSFHRNFNGFSFLDILLYSNNELMGVIYMKAISKNEIYNFH